MPRGALALHPPSAWRSRRANTACSFFPPSGNCASSWGYGHVRYRWHIFLEDFTEILLSLISNESGHMMISNWSFFLDLYLSRVGPVIVFLHKVFLSLVLRYLFGPNGPCIQLSPVWDANPIHFSKDFFPPLPIFEIHANNLNP